MSELSELKTKVDLEKFLVYCNYRLRKDKTTHRWPVYTNGNETVVVHARDNIKLYFVQNGDRGSVIDFCLNRPELLKGYEGTPVLQVKKLLYEFLNFHQTAIVTHSQCVNIDDRPFCIPNNCSFQYCQSMEGKNLKYLFYRGILQKTLTSPAFENIGLFFNGSTGYTNVAFPLYNYKKEIQGLDLRGFRYKSFAPSSHKNECIWLSNNLKAPDEVVIGESPIDMLSFHQLFRENCQNILYISTAGNMGYRQLETLLNFLKDITSANPDVTIIPAFDNDISGAYYTLKLVFSLIENKKIWPEYIDPNHQKLCLSNQQFYAEIKACCRSKNKEFADISAIPKAKTYDLIFPSNIKTIQGINRLGEKISQAIKIKSQIPLYKDWNEALTNVQYQKTNSHQVNSANNKINIH